MHIAYRYLQLPTGAIIFPTLPVCSQTAIYTVYNNVAKTSHPPPPTVCGAAIFHIKITVDKGAKRACHYSTLLEKIWLPPTVVFTGYESVSYY
jgi:hypothetical protein